MIQYQQYKFMFSIDDKSVDNFDPQFLTFRHNSPEIIPSSGRSIYSQRFDYKSLQKYPIFDVNNSETHDEHVRTYKKIKHTVKQKHLRTVRSQDKYKQILSPHIYNAQQYNEDNTDYDIQHSMRKANSNSRQQTSNISIKSRREGTTQRDKHQTIKKQSKQTKLQKNLELKSKLNKLVRNMKKQQRKQIALDQEIQQIQMQIQHLDKEIEEQDNSILQLKQISQQNMKQCNRIIDHIQGVSSTNQEIAANLENLEQSLDSSEISVETSRQDEVKDRVLCSKIKDNISDLNRMRASAQNRIAKLYQQIEAMQEYIQQLKSQQNQVAKILSLNWQNPGFTNSNRQSHNSSSGSNTENTYYY